MTSFFVDPSIATVRDLQANDSAVTVLHNIAAAGGPISFDWLRTAFKSSNGDKVHASLDRGRAVLGATSQLDQYLYSHGLMIQSQWANMSHLYPVDHAVDRLIDYGCGQGLAGLLLHDNLDDDLFDSITKIILVEPSAIALVRAEAVYRCIAPNSEIYCINKEFDDVKSSDLQPDGSTLSVHVFSNVLDINGFDQERLLKQALTPGMHTILAVSHDRDQFGGSGRIRALKAAIEKPASQYSILNSDIAQFNCDTNLKSAAISWLCTLEAPDE